LLVTKVRHSPNPSSHSPSCPGCCPSGTICCGTTCCTAGYTCSDSVSGVCQNPNSAASTQTTSSSRNTRTNTITSETGSDGYSTATQTANESKTNPAVIGGAVGGAIGGVVLIGGCIAAWYFYNRAGSNTTAGAAQPAGHGWTTGGGAPGSPPTGQPQMASTSHAIWANNPLTSTAAPYGAGAGLAAQPPYGLTGSPYQPSSTPSNATEYAHSPVGQYSYSAHDAAAPPSSASGSAPWAHGQAYGQPSGFAVPENPGPSYYASTPAPSYAAGSAYSGMEPMQPGQAGYGGFDSSIARGQTPSSPVPQVQTWVERPGGH
jgi:hypothetical protein